MIRRSLEVEARDQVCSWTQIEGHVTWMQFTWRTSHIQISVTSIGKKKKKRKKKRWGSSG